MSEPCFSNFNLSINNIFSRSAPRFFSRKLFYKITLTTLAKNVYLFGEQNTCYFDRAPQGLLPKQKQVATCDFLRRTPSQIFSYDFSSFVEHFWINS